MNRPESFIATSAEEAVAKIRARLGPEAVVLNVRPLPANGLARFWRKPLIEVLAYVPESKADPMPQISDVLSEFREQLDEIKQQVQNTSPRVERKFAGAEEEFSTQDSSADYDIPNTSGGWRVGTILKKAGLLPLPVQSILDQLRSENGEIPPDTLEGELELTRRLLVKLWRKPEPVAQHSRHVLVGPAGSGKTTCLSKWLTRTALVEGRLARVWRLDGATANMAESLSVYCEILGVPHERALQTNAEISEDIGFIDLPGIDWRNRAAMDALGKQLVRLGSPQIHLTINGAYETSILLAQVRAFSVLPLADIIVTHLDEETRWGKIWNLALGTNYSIRYFSTGQNIPGDFHEASAEMILARQFLRK